MLQKCRENESFTLKKKKKKERKESFPEKAAKCILSPNCCVYAHK